MHEIFKKMLAAAQPGSMPADPEKFIEEMQAELKAAFPEKFSATNPFFRAASRMQKGEASGDAIAQELYVDSTRVEAREWLRQGAELKQKRFIHTYSPRKTAKFFEELYAAGAMAVWILDPEGDASLQTSDDVIVDLPADPAARRALARIHHREMAKVWCYESDDEPEMPSGGHLVFQYT